jgi:hypothetical protein
MTQGGGAYGVKCICNGVDVHVIEVNLIKRSHVKCMNRYNIDNVVIIEEGVIWMYECIGLFGGYFPIL